MHSTAELAGIGVYAMLFDEIDKLKAEIDKIRPFEGAALKQIKAYYRIGLTIGGKPLRDIYEATGY